MEYKTKSQRVLGIDPGIANTGLAVVSHGDRDDALVASRLVKTKASASTGQRLEIIKSELLVMVSPRDVDCIAIEHVFHNKNISSSLSTAKVIGLVNREGDRACQPRR